VLDLDPAIWEAIAATGWCIDDRGWRCDMGGDLQNQKGAAPKCRPRADDKGKLLGGVGAVDVARGER
jgi:hypothetical protein